MDVPVTVPTLGLILRLVGPVTFHDSVLELPVAIEAGFAVKLLMTGTGVDVTVTVVAAVTEPLLLLAVSV